MKISGVDRLAILISGNSDVDAIAELAKGKLREKKDALARSLRGVAVAISDSF